MTPGYGKPRSELPWLPYESEDRVIINSHNFTQPADWTVNGKSPLIVWCPSKDDAGNGTTTLNDLIGSNDITLTNFALSGSTSNWVSDTDAGGIRAIAADGTNDYGTLAAKMITSGSFSYSLWVKATNTATAAVVFGQGDDGGNWHRVRFDGTGKITCSVDGSTTNLTSNASLSSGVWYHIGVTYNTTGTAARLWVDGTQQTSTGSTAANYTGTRTRIFSNTVATASGFFAGRLDDIRVFDSVLDSSDFAYLYNSGSGRGRS